MEESFLKPSSFSEARFRNIIVLKIAYGVHDGCVKASLTNDFKNNIKKASIQLEIMNSVGEEIMLFFQPIL